MKMDRLNLLSLQKESNEDPQAWWNRISTMPEEEMRMLPYGFIKKYGSYLNSIVRMDHVAHLEENKSIKDFWRQIKNLDRLKTDEEKVEAFRELAWRLQDDKVETKDLVREEGDYMRRQPRVDLSKMAYNFE